MGSFYTELTPAQQKALAIAPKPFAALSFLASAYLIVYILRNPAKRKKMYHRLIVGMSINSLIQSFVFFLGTWPIPKDAPGFYGAAGTVGTCTAQGFMMQFAFTVPFYYAALSLYAFVAVRNDFKEERIVWMEKYIHVGVPVVPLATAIGLLKKEMLNPIGPWCWIESYPIGCEGDECIRGMEDLQKIGMQFAGIPMFSLLGFATLMMILLYWTERRRWIGTMRTASGKSRILEDARRKKSGIVARQAGFYLASFYLTYSVAIVACIGRVYTGKINFPTYIIGSCFQPLTGLMNLIVYFGLQRTQKKVDPTSDKDRRRSSFLTQTSFRSDINSSALQSQETIKTTVSHGTAQCSSDQEWSREEFTIFDGTNPSDQWKEFIFDDDDDDVEDEEKGRDDNCMLLDSDELPPEG